MKKIIAKLLQEGKLCSIFTDNAEKFAVGYILAADTEFVLYGAVDPYGRDDGLCCLKIDSIFRIETDTEYIKDMELLFRYRGEVRRQKIAAVDVLDAVLTEALHGKKLCTVELCGSGCDDVIGYLTEIAGENLGFAMLDEHGNSDGQTVFERGSISSIKFESEDERKIAALFRLKSAK